jgi:poly(3-hydroxybutyrate) depolymerase
MRGSDRHPLLDWPPLGRPARGPLTVPRNTLLWFAIVGVLLGAAVWRMSGGQPSSEGRLTFSAHPPGGQPSVGVSALGLESDRDGFVFVPRANAAAAPMPLLILLHGATQRADLFAHLPALADSLGVVILA